jgi:PAS domain S-box-containing protein
VTELTKAAKALKESEERYWNLVALCPDAIGVIQDFKFQFINSEFSRLSGYDQDDLDKGLSYIKTVSKHDRDRIRER